MILNSPRATTVGHSTSKIEKESVLSVCAVHNIFVTIVSDSVKRYQEIIIKVKHLFANPADNIRRLKLQEKDRSKHNFLEINNYLEKLSLFAEVFSESDKIMRYRKRCRKKILN